MTTVQREIYYQELLYSLLPELYRSRDTRGDLRDFTALFGHEFARLRANIDQLWQDFYVDSCQDWALHYIADLVDTNLVFNEGGRNRADVKNTIKWRREKGTLTGLENVASEIGGWGVVAVEMLGRLIWGQNLNHRRPQSRQALDVADASAVARVRTPFDTSARSVDFRPFDGTAGAWQIPNVAFYLWPLASQPIHGTDPVNAGSGRYFFDPLGWDRILFAGGDKGSACTSSNGALPADICFPHADHVPIRGRDFRDHIGTYFGTRPGFSVYQDGILVCLSDEAPAAPSTIPCVDYAELALVDGIIAADPTLFGSPSKKFRVTAARLAAKTGTVAPEGPFDENYILDGENGDLDSTAFTYSKGVPYEPGAPEFHVPQMLIQIERLGADGNFPECELIIRNAIGSALLVFLPAVSGLTPGHPFRFYIAYDGSAYYARGDHAPGDIDLTPGSTSLGAYLPRHLARAAGPQVRPRPTVRPVAHRRAVYRPLCCWHRPLQNPPAPGEVAFDPEHGRFVFPASEVPGGKLTADFRFALTGSVGAGPYFRDSLPVPSLTVAQVADARHRTIQDAVNAAPRGSLSPVVIEIADSHTYVESVTIGGAFPGGLRIQARALEAPVLKSAGGDAIAVTGALGTFALDGVIVSGGHVNVAGNVADLQIRFCSLDPHTSGLTIAPGVAGSTVTIRNSIVGRIAANANVAGIAVFDSIVQQPAGASPAISAIAQAVSLERVTVAGETRARTLYASNTILFGPLSVTDVSSSCCRYTGYPNNSPSVRSFRCTSAFPIFGSTEYGHPAYMYLTPNTAAAIRSGAENGGEMGAFYSAGLPWREENISTKTNEFLPAGLRAVSARVLPLVRFAGVTRI